MDPKSAETDASLVSGGRNIPGVGGGRGSKNSIWRMAADFRIIVLRYSALGRQKTMGGFQGILLRRCYDRAQSHVLDRKKIARNSIYGYFKCIYIWWGQERRTETE